MKIKNRTLSFLLAMLMIIPMFTGVFTFTAAAEVTNVALNKTVIAAGSNPQAITNGNTNDYWDGGAYPQSATIDLGGYYLHQMINLLGSIKKVTGFGGNLNPVRTFINPKHPRYGETMEIDTPTTLLAALEFENGVLEVKTS